jgi:outer membrane cobalamin receptor
MWNVLAGFGYILDRASGYSVYGRPSFQLSENPADTSANADIQSIYGFLQCMVKFSAFNVTAGFRYEDTDLGSALAPRVGITFVQDKFNAKLLYGRAFRVPMPWQAFSRRWPPIVGAGLQPEITNSAEMELGYKFSKNVQAKINGYYNTIEDQIIFVVSAYTNSPEKVSNMGIEATLNANWEDYGGYLNFSYCKPLDAKLSDYTVVFDENQEALGLIGYPQMMGNMGLYYKYGKFTFAPSLTYLGKRYSQNPTAEELEAGSYSNMRYTENDPLLMLNFAITAREILPKIDATVSMHNIGGAEYSLIQGYFDAHAPIPANDRQITLRITARIN